MAQPFWEKAYKDLATPAIRGGVPSPEIREIAAQLPPAARVLDLGCGEGRNALFLAECGFKVTAVDISAAGIRKLNTLAGERRLDIRSEVADMRTYRFPGPFDLIVSLSPPRGAGVLAATDSPFQGAHQPRGLQYCRGFYGCDSPSG